MACFQSLFFAIFFLSLFGISEQAKYADKVLLVSMDGFRWDYLNKTDTPQFDAFIKDGVKVDYVNSSFITETFPCHYTIATGVYEETHGIVGNHMYDPLFNETFGRGSKETKWWNESEPIWCRVKRFNLKSAAYFWPGSETEINGRMADKWLKYDETVPFRKRVDDVIEWYVKDQINMVALYFHEPDRTGHTYGPESPEMENKVKEMDGIVGYLMKKLDENRLRDKVNVIITSDHGMFPVDPKNKVIDIYDHVDRSLIARFPSHGESANLLPVDGQADTVVAKLKNVSHITVYHKRDIPDRLHYKNNRRIMPVFVMADEGWLITDNKTEMALYETDKGAHGWDNSLMSMKPIFFASGPNFKKNVRFGPIESVDIFPLICELMGIPAGPTNGSLERVKEFLVPFDVNAAQMVHIQCLLMFLGLFVFILFSKKN